MVPFPRIASASMARRRMAYAPAPFIDRRILECLQRDGRISNPKRGIPCGNRTSASAFQHTQKTRPHTEPIHPENKNGLALVRTNPLICVMVGVAGFELATPCTPCKCATRLRYTPKGEIINVYDGKMHLQPKIGSNFWRNTQRRNVPHAMETT